VLKDLPGLEEMLKDLLKDRVKRSPPAGGISWMLKSVKRMLKAFNILTL
jgi:hypothetical protein